MTLLRDVPSFAGYFFVYEGGKRAVARWQRKSEAHLTVAELLLCGGLAGFGAWIPCYPQDVLKSRIQSSAGRLTVRGALAGILREHGLRGFLRGLGPTMARAFPANAATFLAYETVRGLLE